VERTVCGLTAANSPAVACKKLAKLIRADLRTKFWTRNWQKAKQ